MRFLSSTNVFLVTNGIYHVTLTVGQHDIHVWSTHLDVISMKISIHSNCSTSHPIWEILPVWGQIDSRLRTRGFSLQSRTYSGNSGRIPEFRPPLLEGVGVSTGLGV